nr:hypothetical protein BaRGS_015387 [Batillaria attramentaria]
MATAIPKTKKKKSNTGLKSENDIISTQPPDLHQTPSVRATGPPAVLRSTQADKNVNRERELRRARQQEEEKHLAAARRAAVNNTQNLPQPRSAQAGGSSPAAGVQECKMQSVLKFQAESITNDPATPPKLKESVYTVDKGLETLSTDVQQATSQGRELTKPEKKEFVRRAKSEVQGVMNFLNVLEDHLDEDDDGRTGSGHGGPTPDGGSWWNRLLRWLLDRVTRLWETLKSIVVSGVEQLKSLFTRLIEWIKSLFRADDKENTLSNV